ncbi:MAG: sugar phosphate isomerase/epimerase family protein [Bacteroidota bacterium]
MKRRKFLENGALAGTGLVLSPWLLNSCASENTADTETKAAEMSTAADAGEMFFSISLAEWSLHKALFEGKITNLDFPAITKNEFGIDAVEYVNQFFKDKAEDKVYLQDLKTRADDNGVKSLLIMIDGEGGLGAIDDAERAKAVENHYKWVEAAQYLGCHSIRVNAYGQATADEVSAAAVDALGSLATFAQDYNINIIVENHGGYSSNGDWMSNVIQSVNMPNCGMLPDFGNFIINRDTGESYDRYRGVEQFMPYAKGVSAKSHNFDENGDETATDYRKMLQIVKNAGYTGYIGIEYEGSEMDEYAGVHATKDLLMKIGAELS